VQLDEGLLVVEVVLRDFAGGVVLRNAAFPEVSIVDVLGCYVEVDVGR